MTDQAQALRDMVGFQPKVSSVSKTEAAVPVQQASTIITDEPVERLVKRTGPRVLAITSGKGGVGKTNVAVNLAVRLSQMGRRVLLLDADLGTANADVICNMNPVYSLAHVVAGRRRLEDVAMDAPGGFRLIPGASGLAEMAALGAIERDRLLLQLDEMERKTDLVLIDTAAGVGPNVLGFLVNADQQLVVTTPEPTSITDAYAVIKTLVRQRKDVELRLLVNMVRNANEAREVYDRISAVCQRFLRIKLGYAGHIVNDSRVTMAVRGRQPFVLMYPRTEASTNVGQLAHRVDRHANEPDGRGLVSRLSRWLGRSV